MTMKLSALLAGAYLAVGQDAETTEEVPIFAQYMARIEAAMTGLKSMTEDEVNHTKNENANALLAQAKVNSEELNNKLLTHKENCDSALSEQVNTINGAHAEDKATKIGEWEETEAKTLESQKAGFENDLHNNAAENAAEKKAKLTEAQNTCDARVATQASNNAAKFDAETAALASARDEEHAAREQAHATFMSEEQGRLEAKIADALEELRQEHAATTAGIQEAFATKFSDTTDAMHQEFDANLSREMANMDNASREAVAAVEAQFTEDLAALVQAMADKEASELAAQQAAMDAAAAAKYAAMEAQLQTAMSDAAAALAEGTSNEIQTLKTRMAAQLEAGIAQQNDNYRSESAKMTENFRSARAAAQSKYNAAKEEIVGDLTDGYNGIVTKVESKVAGLEEGIEADLEHIPETVMNVFGSSQSNLLDTIRNEAGSVIGRINEWVAGSPTVVPENR